MKIEICWMPVVSEYWRPLQVKILRRIKAKFVEAVSFTLVIALLLFCQCLKIKSRDAELLATWLLEPLPADTDLGVGNDRPGSDSQEIAVPFFGSCTYGAVVGAADECRNFGTAAGFAKCYNDLEGAWNDSEPCGGAASVAARDGESWINVGECFSVTNVEQAVYIADVGAIDGDAAAMNELTDAARAWCKDINGDAEADPGSFSTGYGGNAFRNLDKASRGAYPARPGDAGLAYSGRCVRLVDSIGAGNFFNYINYTADEAMTHCLGVDGRFDPDRWSVEFGLMHEHEGQCWVSTLKRDGTSRVLQYVFKSGRFDRNTAIAECRAAGGVFILGYDPDAPGFLL